MSTPHDTGSRTATEPDGDHADLRAEAGRAIRDVGHALVGHLTSDDVLRRLVAELDALTAELATGTPRSREPENFMSDKDGPLPADGEPMGTTHDERPVSGRSSPYGLDPTIRRVGDEVEAVVKLRAAHEGAPGRSHGGIVAALFDDIYGFVLSLQQTPGFTGEQLIRYEAATPLHVPLTCRVRLASREGRKLFMTGELTTPDGTVCVRSKATFITIDPTKVPWSDGV